MAGYPHHPSQDVLKATRERRAIKVRLHEVQAFKHELEEKIHAGEISSTEDSVKDFLKRVKFCEDIFQQSRKYVENILNPQGHHVVRTCAQNAQNCSINIQIVNEQITKAKEAWKKICTRDSASEIPKVSTASAPTTPEVSLSSNISPPQVSTSSKVTMAQLVNASTTPRVCASHPQSSSPYQCTSALSSTSCFAKSSGVRTLTSVNKPSLVNTPSVSKSALGSTLSQCTTSGSSLPLTSSSVNKSVVNTSSVNNLPSIHDKSSQTEEPWEERDTLTSLNHLIQHLTQKLTTEHQQYEQSIDNLNEKIWNLTQDLHKERENSKRAEKHYKETLAKSKALWAGLCNYTQKVKEQRNFYENQGIQLLSEKNEMERRLLDAKCRLKRWADEAATRPSQSTQDILMEIQHLQEELNIGMYI